MTNNRAEKNEWPDPKSYKKSFCLEFSNYVSLIIVVLMGVTGYIITDKYVETVTINEMEKLLVQARSFSGSAGKLIISSNGPDELLLNNICSKLNRENPNLFWAGVTDKQNRYIAHTDLNQVIQSRKAVPISRQKFGEILKDNERADIIGDSILISIAIVESGVSVGGLILASSAEVIDEARISSIITVSSISLVMLILGIPLTMVFLRKKLRPINTITTSLKNLNYDNIEIDIPCKLRNEFGYLSKTLEVMGKRLNHARQELIEKERYSRELEIAREIQANILPGSYPKGASYEFAGMYRSALEVGGDYFDFIDYDDEHIAFLVADVSGKSLPGMLVMLMIRDIVRNIAASLKNPPDILIRANAELRQNVKEGMFVTMFYGLLNKITGRFVFVSAGHNPLIILDAQTAEIRTVKTDGFPLGLMSDEAFKKRIETGQLNLKKNDLLVQFTDGVNEANNNDGLLYGMERFMTSLKEHGRLNVQNLTKAIIADQDKFIDGAPQFDDITLLVMKWVGTPADNIINRKVEEIYEN